MRYSSPYYPKVSFTEAPEMCKKNIKFVLFTEMLVCLVF